MAEQKKKSRRLKRTVRKTLGTVCLISAILVATIPTEGLKRVEAGNPPSKLPESEIAKKAKELDSKIPDLNTYTGTITVYNSGNGYQFAYVKEDGSGGGSSNDKLAILVGFDYNNAMGTSTLDGNTLIIPETLDAYLNYKATDGSYGSYAAVSQDEKFLFYEASPAIPAVTDVSGNEVIEISPAVPASYQPCFYKDFDKWGYLDDEDLYYYNTTDSKPATTTNPTTGAVETTPPIQVKDAPSGVRDQKMRIKNAPVRYIGNNYTTVNTSTGEYEIATGKTDKEHKVFGNIGNVTALRIEAVLFGIGDYAFYDCVNLRSVELTDQMTYIGNYAFANCRNMINVDLSYSARVRIIGAHAFENCQALQTFHVPYSTKVIGDAAFKGCAGDASGLRSIVFREGTEYNPNLEELGIDLFVGCNKLTSITFPGCLTEDVDISNFEGCTSLQSIAVCSNTMNITEGYTDSASNQVAFDFEDFKEQYQNSNIVHGTFYFEGPTEEKMPSELHKTAMSKGFAFSYLDDNLDRQGIYELTTWVKTDGSPATSTTSGAKKAIYRVSGPEYPLGANKLISHELDAGIESLTLPKYIGPQTISTLASGVFQDYCSMKGLTIPSTVQHIETDAFSGCHNLQFVMFEEPENLAIDRNAFHTQEFKSSGHLSGCSGISTTDDPELIFVGPISNAAEPFRYAMNESNVINNKDQVPTYITYYSGWPANQVVRRNASTHRNELVDYLKLDDLKNPDDSYLNKAYSKINVDLCNEYVQAAENVYKKKIANTDSNPMTGTEGDLFEAFMNIVLPDGVESIQDGLFRANEVAGSATSGIVGNAIPLPIDGAYKTLTTWGLKEVPGDDDLTDQQDTGCFAGCTAFSYIALYGSDTEAVGDHAFKDCTNLAYVTLPDTVHEMGLAPFIGCTGLTDVNFQGGPYYTCDNSIIYKLDGAGNKEELVEYLGGRTSNLGKEEAVGIQAIAKESFANTKIRIADLSLSEIKMVPEHAFENCSRLQDVILPNSVGLIESEAFKKCPLMNTITIPAVSVAIRADAFDTDGPDRPNDLTFYCSEDSDAKKYADVHGFGVETTAPVYKIVFICNECAQQIGDALYREAGLPVEMLSERKLHVHEGREFDKWTFRGEYDPGEDETEIRVKGDLEIIALYKDANNSVPVIFYLNKERTQRIERTATIGMPVDQPMGPAKSEDGREFVGWGDGLNISGDPVEVTDPITMPTFFYAIYKAKVTFVDDFDDSPAAPDQYIRPGDPLILVPPFPTRAGVEYYRWSPAIPEQITTDMEFRALYREPGASTPPEDESGNATDGSNANDGSNPADGSDASNPDGNGTSPSTPSKGEGEGDENSGSTAKLYTLLVQNGSGSGSYAAKSQPIIVANDPPSGYEFSNWTIDPTDAKIASKVMSATVITMPEENVTVTAHYKAKTGSTSGSGSVSGNNSYRPNGSTNALSKGTTVVIDKNGLSNTGVVSATVKGSSDNFTIKVTESSAAAEAVVRALKAEYGDISNLKYFPMDISLYDSTGTRKITDTSGLSITVTLPLPDSLITYAGNNQVAGVVNDRLDKLSPKFTTIDKVACVTFTAEHFSPYVIYVETDNLSKGVAVDNTPKTGDGIHPKWFLSIGLACMAMVLFMKKDKRTLQKAGVA